MWRPVKTAFDGRQVTLPPMTLHSLNVNSWLNLWAIVPFHKELDVVVDITHM